jgi:Flp pilus assembly protein TadB
MHAGLRLYQSHVRGLLKYYLAPIVIVALVWFFIPLSLEGRLALVIIAVTIIFVADWAYMKRRTRQTNDFKKTFTPR